MAIVSENAFVLSLCAATLAPARSIMLTLPTVLSPYT
jgi:hypothetical protein